jgi:hypothetical protein
VRAVSTVLKAALFGPETGEAFLILLEISHPDLAAPIRAVNNTTDVTSGGNLYTATAFDIQLPDDTSEKPPQVTLSICNVDRSILIAIAEIITPPTVTISVIAASTPDVIEVGPLTFTLLSVEYDALVIRGTLGFAPILNEPFPADSFTPDLFPGLF